MHPEIDEIGYHCRDYFVKQWDRFSGPALGVTSPTPRTCAAPGPGTRTPANATG